MSFAAELAKEGQRLEYFITLEGAGWPTNGLHGSLSGGFDGLVWTTNDFEGTLASDLGCTVYHGLELPDGISESINPPTAEYVPSGLSFTIQDHDDWWVANLIPRKTQTTQATTAGLLAYGEKIYIDSGAGYVEGDQVWLGGRELVLLGSRALVGGTEYSYSGSTRGYLGTQRGSSLRRPADYCGGVWPIGTEVSDHSRWWFNRQVALWAHVPGETVSNVQLLWYGRVRDIANPEAGLTWEISCAGDFMSTVSRIRRAVDWPVQSTRLESTASSRYSLDLVGAASGAKRLLEFNPPDIELPGQQGDGGYELAAAYNYRYDLFGGFGGTYGMVTSWDGGTVQALDLGSETDTIKGYVYIDGSVYFMHGRDTEFSTTATGRYKIRADVVPHAGKSVVESLPLFPDGRFASMADLTIAPGSVGRFLLANTPRTKEYNRFTVDGEPRRNVVDVLLAFMLTMDYELAYLTTNGASATPDYITFAAEDWSNDALIGKALFSVDDDNQFEAKPISDNTNARIDVGSDFSANPGNAKEYQVRNSIYDVLPFGWGLGIDSNMVDIDTFEEMRDKYLSECRVGDFMLGVKDEINIWEFLVENICKPYGILVYFDYNTRKISARYIGPTPADGTFEDYTAIARSDIIKAGNLKHTMGNPIGSVKLTVRAVEDKIADIKEIEFGDSYLGGMVNGGSKPGIKDTAERATTMDGKTVSVILKSTELITSFSETDLDRVEFQAMLNTENDFESLAGHLVGMISEYCSPPPVWTPELDISLYTSLVPGSYVSITWSTPDAPANPFTGNRGWTNVVGRVLERRLSLRGLTVPVSIELLYANLISRIAPAAIVSSKGNDVNGDYFVVEDTNFVNDPDNDKDWWHFAVGDLIELRDENGAFSDGPEEITAFGSNQASDPEDAIDSRVYIAGGIGPAIGVGDYITLSPWSASNTARMDLYAAYADASGDLTGGDTARQYG